MKTILIIMAILLLGFDSFIIYKYKNITNGFIKEINKRDVIINSLETEILLKDIIYGE